MNRLALTLALLFVAGGALAGETHVTLHDGGGSVGYRWHWPSGLAVGGELTTSNADALTAACRSGGCSLDADGNPATIGEAVAFLEGQDIQTATMTAGYRLELADGLEATLSAALHWYHETGGSLQPGLELRLTKDQLLGYASWHDLDLAGFTPLAGRSLRIRGEVVRVGIGWRF